MATLRQTYLNQTKISRNSGQAVLEYIFLLAIVSVLITVLSRGVIASIDAGVLSFGARLERTLKTGRLPVDIWEN